MINERIISLNGLLDQHFSLIPATRDYRDDLYEKMKQVQKIINEGMNALSGTINAENDHFIDTVPTSIQFEALGALWDISQGLHDMAIRFNRGDI